MLEEGRDLEIGRSWVVALGIGDFHLEVEPLSGREHDHPAEHAGGGQRRLPGRLDQCEARQIEAVCVTGGLFKREEEKGEIERHDGIHINVMPASRPGSAAA
jgi:hypothetical protein